MGRIFLRKKFLRFITSILIFANQSFLDISRIGIFEIFHEQLFSRIGIFYTFTNVYFCEFEERKRKKFNPTSQKQIKKGSATI